MPGPQAALLLDPALTDATRVVQAQRWSPSLAAVLRFPTRRWPDFRGAFVNDHPVLNLVCDDGDRRGDGAPVLVAHTVPEFAAGHLAQPTGAGPAIEQAVRDLLGLPEPADARARAPLDVREADQRRRRCHLPPRRRRDRPGRRRVRQAPGAERLALRPGPRPCPGRPPGP